MMGMKSIEDTLKEFIIKEFMEGNTDVVFENDEHLIRKGVIDSLGIFVIVAFMDKNLNITVAEQDITLANFQTINAMADLVRKKQKERI